MKTKSPYPDAKAAFKYFEWGIVRKHWSTQGTGSSGGATKRAYRYRLWYQKAYIRTRIMCSVKECFWNSPRKRDHTLTRKLWKQINSRTEYLYIRDFI